MKKLMITIAVIITSVMGFQSVFSQTRDNSSPNAGRFQKDPDNYQYQKPRKANPERWNDPYYRPNDADMRAIAEKFYGGDKKRADTLEDALQEFYKGNQ